MIYIVIWTALGLAVATFFAAAGARERAEEAYELARDSMVGHYHVAEVLAEHHARLADVEQVIGIAPPDAPDEGETSND
jgi:hypothetical protein